MPTVAALEQPTQDVARPRFCGDLDCPKFKVLREAPGYQVREYAAGTWVTTTVANESYQEASAEAFKRLMAYFSGGNSDQTEIELAVPLVTVLPSTSLQLEQDKRHLTFALFLAHKYQASPPQPSFEEVQLCRTERATVYVRSFTEFVKDEDGIDAQAGRLHHDLKDAGEMEVNSSALLFAVYRLYDPTTREKRRHNEVAYPQGELTRCQSSPDGQVDRSWPVSSA